MAWGVVLAFRLRNSQQGLGGRVDRGKWGLSGSKLGLRWSLYRLLRKDVAPMASEGSDFLSGVRDDGVSHDNTVQQGARLRLRPERLFPLESTIERALGSDAHQAPTR